MKTMQQEFDHYLKLAYHGIKLHPGQLLDVERAFFAGAYVMSCKCFEIGAMKGISDLQGADLVETLHKELTLRCEMLTQNHKNQ